MNEYHNVVDVVQNNALLSHHQLLDNLIMDFMRAPIYCVW